MFLAHLDDGAVRHADILAALRNTPPPIVYPIRLDDESISPSLRGIAGPHGAFRADEPRVFLRECAEAEGWIRSALCEIAALAPEGPARAAALAPTASLRDLVRMLSEAPAGARCEFAGRLARAGSLDLETRRFLEAKFDNVAHSLTTAERAALGCSLLSDGETEAVARLLRSSESLEQLCALVETLDGAALAPLSPTLRECVGLATYLPVLQRIPLTPASEPPPGCEVEHRIAALQAGLAEALRTCLGGGILADTTAAADLRTAIIDDLRSLERDLAAAETPEQKDSVAAVYRAAAELEFRYGVDITTGAADDLMSFPAHGVDHLVWRGAGASSEAPRTWRLKDIEEIGVVLANLPEGQLLQTARLNRIELVPTLGEGVLGARYQDDGRIKIAAAALDHAGISAAVHAVSSLVFVLTHEIGHGFQIGSGQGGYVFEAGRPDFAPGEPAVDFREFAGIAGWAVVDPARVTPGKRFNSVVLDGCEAPIGEPFEHNGRKIVLFHNPFSGIVVSVDATGEFSERWYSRTSPWEDFAEAFAYYFTCPDALILDAPHKFRHLDEEFHRYEGDEVRRKLLAAALEIHRVK